MKGELGRLMTELAAGALMSLCIGITGALAFAFAWVAYRDDGPLWAYALAICPAVTTWLAARKLGASGGKG